MSDMYTPFSDKMDRKIEKFDNELKTIRAGRANPAVLSKINVDYYGVPTPVNQMAAISVSEARILVIQPWDVSTLGLIEKAIQASDLGINPTNDGKLIRIVFPSLTEDRRKEIVKTIHKYGEEAKVSIRNVRRSAIEEFKKMKKNGELTEDDLKDAESKIQKITDKHIEKIGSDVKEKEKEILEI